MACSMDTVWGPSSKPSGIWNGSGVITTETIGRAGVHRINENHEAVAPLRSLASPIEMLTRVVRDAASNVEAVLVFGSVARGEARAESDIDLVVVAPESWDGRDPARSDAGCPRIRRTWRAESSELIADANGDIRWRRADRSSPQWEQLERCSQLSRVTAVRSGWGCGPTAGYADLPTQV